MAVTFVGISGLVHFSQVLAPGHMEHLCSSQGNMQPVTGERRGGPLQTDALTHGGLGAACTEGSRVTEHP